MPLTFRQANLQDLSEIVRMLADDFLGQTRERYEDPLPGSYIDAFREIEKDHNNELIVAVMSDEDIPDREFIVGTLQLAFTPSISMQGGRRATVESVRVDDKYRGTGIGREMMLWAIERARAKGCIAMQLSTNSDRADARRFYTNLGFIGSHLGMKLKING